MKFIDNSNQVKLNNGYQQFPVVFNIRDLEVADFQNGDLSQGIVGSLLELSASNKIFKKMI